MDDRDREEVDRASRGRRIFDALRRRPEDDEPDESPAEGSAPTTTVAEPPEDEGGNGSAPAVGRPSPESADVGSGRAEGADSEASSEPEAAPKEEPPLDSPKRAESERGPLPGVADLESRLHTPASAGGPPSDLAPPSAPVPPGEPSPETEPGEPSPETEPGEPSPDMEGKAAPPTEGEPSPAPAADVPGEEATPAPAPPTEPEEPEERLPLPRVLAIANQKGGVGKTTTAVNLGAALAELGYRVLIVDLDPQGNATTGVGIDIRNLAGTLYESLMGDTPLEDCVEPTSVRNLFIAPSNMELAGAEIELVPMFSRELKLRRAIEPAKPDYDFVLIDCPPSLGLLTVNGLAAADDVVVPIQCEYYALEGLGQLVNNVNLVRANLNPVLDIRGIVLTMYDARTKLADQVVDEVRSHFANKVFKTVVPRTVRLSEAPSFGQPIIVFDASSRGAEAYRSLAQELADRVDGRPQGASGDGPGADATEGAQTGHPQEPTGSPTG